MVFLSSSFPHQDEPRPLEVFHKKGRAHHPLQDNVVVRTFASVVGNPGSKSWHIPTKSFSSSESTFSNQFTIKKIPCQLYCMCPWDFLFPSLSVPDRGAFLRGWFGCWSQGASNSHVQLNAHCHADVQRNRDRPITVVSKSLNVTVLGQLSLLHLFLKRNLHSRFFTDRREYDESRSAPILAFLSFFLVFVLLD